MGSTADRLAKTLARRRRRRAASAVYGRLARFLLS